jgi:hypothetical protein
MMILQGMHHKTVPAFISALLNKWAKTVMSLNRIQKPRSEVVTDTQDAKQQWRFFLRENQSIIVEVFIKYHNKKQKKPLL